MMFGHRFIILSYSSRAEKKWHPKPGARQSWGAGYILIFSEYDRIFGMPKSFVYLHIISMATLRIHVSETKCRGVLPTVVASQLLQNLVAETVRLASHVLGAATASEGADPRDLHGSQSQDSRASDQSKHKFSKRTKTLWFAHVPLWFTFLFVLLTQERRGMPGGRMGPWTSGVGHSPNNTFNSLCVLVIYCLACTFLDLKHKPSLDFTTYFFIMGSMSHLCFL